MPKISLSDISSHVQTIFSYINQHKSLLLTLLILLLLSLLPLAYRDYRGWYGLGAGGLPHNPVGWLLQSLLRLRASRNVRDTTPYDTEIRTSSSALEKTSFLANRLPVWEGKLPKTGAWVAPHRQLEQSASKEVKSVCLCVRLFMWIHISQIDVLGIVTRSYKFLF